jgi:hypothetical protein
MVGRASSLPAIGLALKLGSGEAFITDHDGARCDPALCMGLCE